MVSGFGFKPHLTVAFNMCTLFVRGYNDCDPSTTKLPSAYVSSKGTFGPEPFAVTQRIHIPSEKNVLLVCGPDNCSIGVGDPSGLTAGSHCVSFTADPCAPAPEDRFVSAPSSGGSSTAPIVGAAVGAIVLGGAAVVLWRRRRAHQT